MRFYYYLHENGDLICKQDFDSSQAADFRESPFVQHLWLIDPTDRETAWSLLVESLAIGASKERVEELARKWSCDDDDADVYADRIGLDLYRDGDAWCARRSHAINLQECPHGFGDTALEALADLCKQLGMRAQKMWGPTFKSLIECPCDGATKTKTVCASQGECSA